MPELSFRDRLLTRRVGNAMLSPLSILLFGGGTALGVIIGLSLLAPVLGLVAWAVRVFIAMPRGFDADGIDPFDLDDPWRTSVWQAKRSRRNFTEAVKSAKDGPLRDRLDELGGRITTMVEECWEAAKGGNALTGARARIDVAGITQRLTSVNAQRAGTTDSDGTLAATVESLESQLGSAKRMDEVITDTVERLQLLNARLDEAVTRAVELSVRAQSVDDLSGLTTDINDLVHEMESLREVLTEPEPGLPAPRSSAGAVAAPAEALPEGGEGNPDDLVQRSIPEPEPRPQRAPSPPTGPAPAPRSEPLPNEPWPQQGTPDTQ